MVYVLKTVADQAQEINSRLTNGLYSFDDLLVQGKKGLEMGDVINSLASGSKMKLGNVLKQGTPLLTVLETVAWEKKEKDSTIFGQVVSFL